MVGGNWKPPSEDEFNDSWITPLEALEVSDFRMAEDADMWALVEQLRAGQILAVARTAQITEAWSVSPFALVYPGAWQRMNPSDEMNFWKTGHLVVSARVTEATNAGAPVRKERYFNIRFDPASFSGRPPPKIPEEPSIAAEPTTSKGGAPRKGWWDDLWIEMIRRIRANELHPTSGNDLKRIMEEWLAGQEIYPGDDTLKRTANKLFKYLQE